MKNTVSIKRLFSLLLLVVMGSATAARAQSHVVVSQVYGGGGNASATYRYDFVELYNPTVAAVDLSGYTIQYASATSTSASAWSKVQLAGSISPGKYFLAQLCIGNNGSTTGTLLPTPDFIAPNTDTASVSAPTYPGPACVPALAAGAGKVALVGNTTLLSGTAGTVAGLAGTGCPTTNTAAIVDFVGYGSTANCTESSTVSVSRTADLSSSKSAIRNSTNDDTGDNGTDFTVGAPNPRNSAGQSGTGGGGGGGGATTAAISAIQANRSTYLGTSISFTGVITVVKYDGFYVQTASATPGSTGDEGIYVFSTANNVPATALVGNNVTVTGTLTQYPAPTASHTPSLEVTGASLTVNSVGNALPTPIVVTAPTATGDINQFRQYESMLVSLPSMTAVGGTDASLVETTETTTSTGQFYVVGTGTPRPFREPGMDFRDYNATTCPTFANCPASTNPTTAAGQARPANVVLYDDNPERLIIESSLGGSVALDVTAGAVITGATGVVDYTYSTDYPYGDPARIILTAANRPAVTASPLVVKALPLPTAGQFTVAAFNVERFFDPIATNDLYYNPATGKTAGSSAVDVTTAAYARRLQKFSLAVRTVLNNPDIISVEEVENLQVLKDMAAQIDTDTTTGTKPGYVAYGTDSTTTFTNDVGGISIGFLVKPATVNVTTWEQKGNTTLIPAGTSALNDRPSQVLHATINRGTGNKPYPITVISNHLRSLNNVNTVAVQTKKELQAEMLANLIQGYQQAGEHVIAVGDMNAFQFSDGYTDTLGTITGSLSAAGTSVQPGKAIVSPAAVNLINTLPAAQQQSYTEWGNAQVLDHAIVTADIAGTSTLAVGHIDADFPVVLYNDATTPAAMSDHDPLLAYLALPAPVTSATLTGSGTFATPVLVGVSSTGQQITVTNTGEAAITITGLTTTGDFSQSSNCGASLAVNATCLVNVVFKPTAAGTRTGTLTLTSSATVSPVTLTGTGLLPADFTISDSNTGASTSAVTVAAGSSTGVPLVLKSVNGFAGSVTVTCSIATAPTGAACTVLSPVTLAAAGSTTVQMVLSTTARTIGAGMVSGTVTGMTLLLLSVMAVALLFLARAGRAVRAAGVLLLLIVGLTGCGDSIAKQNPNPSGTPAGTYTYTVTATSGSIVHTQTVTLTVQ